MVLQTLYDSLLICQFYTLTFVGHHDEKFSKNRDYHFNANTLNNALTHLLDIHSLDAGGDIWRIKNDKPMAQPSGIVDGDYDRIIPFRQQEFKNAFLEWIICENVKHRKAASRRLKRCFILANKDIANALPTSHVTVESWIHELFTYFEPQVIEEVRRAKSRITVTFDGWGSKREKISVLGVVVHFISDKYEAVTRLIGLPMLPKHGKTGVGIYITF